MGPRSPSYTHQPQRAAPSGGSGPAAEAAATTGEAHLRGRP